MNAGFVHVSRVIAEIMKRREGRMKKIETRAIKGNWKVIYQAEVIWDEEGRAAAERYLRGRGLITDNETLFSSESEYDDRAQPISPYDGGLHVLRVRISGR
jgi:hypothetical protein